MKYSDALKTAYEKADKNIVIPDIKRYSPKDGELLKGRNPAEYAEMLIKAGAPALSVVTEEKEFHGSLDMLKQVSSVAEKYKIPVLRKDFIHTKEDLLATKENGASAILLMCSCLKPDELKYLYKEALALGLDPLVETHEEEDFELVKELGAELIGINNRNILELERDNGNVSHTLSLLKKAPKNAFIISESSISCPEEVRKAIKGGAHAALVGTAISLAPNPASFYRMMTKKTNLKICGIMNEKDLNILLEEGVERIGLVCSYPVPVPWTMDIDKTAALRKLIPKGFKSVVVTGGDPEKVLKIADAVKPYALQLHGSENLKDTAYIASELKKRGILTIRTVPSDKESCIKQFGLNSVEETIEALCKTDVAELLIDPRHGKDVGRADLHADENFFKSIKEISTKPIILAGGLTGSNIKEMVEATAAEAVDIMTGCEIAPGKKDLETIQRIVRNIP